jgi:sugar phosphate permease
MTSVANSIPDPAAQSLRPGAAETALEKRAYRKATARLLPFLFLCYLFAYLDRINVGFAKLAMLNDLHLSEAVYGLGAGIFFAGYFAFEVPSNLIMIRTGARIWIGRIMLTWGVLAAAMLLVHAPWQFYLVRFLLGTAEAGFIPGILYYLTSWYPSYRRGRISALFLMGIPGSGVIGSLLSGWLMEAFKNTGGLLNWQWLFLLEGIPSIVLGVLAFVVLRNTPRDVHWLTADEKAALERNLEAEAVAKTHRSFGDAFREPRVWLLALIYFLFLMGLYGVSFWLPSLVTAAGIKGYLNVGLMSAIPNGVAIIVILLVSRSSDRRRERRWHLAIPGVLGALGLIGSTLVGASNPPLAIAALTVGAAGVCTTVPQFWNLPPNFLASVAAAAGIAFINAVGNLSGFVAPYMVGWLKDETGTTNSAMWVIAGSMILASVLTFALPARLVDK